jgi:glycosyltransferase involved in cell wall biosynthesis
MADSMSGKSPANARTVEDRLIAGLNGARFALTEPPQLWLARLRYAAQYDDSSEEPLVSVCVPTYNRAQLLVDRAVSTVLSQTYRNLELVIVGDHCTDDTAEQLAKLDDPRLRFYNLPSRKRSYKQTVENHWFVGGATPANKAMELARGKWIARVDDDDTWSPDHVEKLLRLAREGKYEFVSGQYIAERFGEQKIVDGVRALDPYHTRKAAIPGDDSPKIGGVATWLYRSYLRFMRYNVQCWRKSWNRVWDVDLAVRLHSAGVRMGFLEEVVAYTLPRPGEKTVGLEAYKLTEKEKLEHYRFDS